MSTADPLANKNLQSNLQWSLLFLRVGVFIVMFIWTLDKFVNPAHSIKIFEHFYKINGLNDIMAYVLGSLQLILVIAFLFGIKKRLSYGLIFLMHAGSTLSAYALYIDAFNNLLFFAAWPMLAACAALYLLRDADTKFTLGK
jgi:putative oxidoreductase